jgi:hypothetical protein
MLFELIQNGGKLIKNETDGFLTKRAKSEQNPNGPAQKIVRFGGICFKTN